MPDAPAPALREQPCSRCGELVAWDDEQPVVCNDCLRAALAEARARAERLATANRALIERFNITRAEVARLEAENEHLRCRVAQG